MYEKLATCVLPVDDLLKELYEQESLDRELRYIRKPLGNYPVHRLVTLDLVNNVKIGTVVRQYISKLLENKEKYGYIYFLSGQKMIIPLDVRFRGIEVFSDPSEKEEIVAAIDKLASEFACRNILMFEITLMECFYFYIRLINPHLTWLATESLLNNMRSHVHLIMSPDRKYTFRVIEEPNDLKDDKIVVCKR